MEAGAEYVFNVKVGYDQIFFELFAPGDELSFFVQNQAAAVEDKLVLPADQVIKSENSHAVRGAGGNHPLAVAAFTEVIGRGADVEDNLGAGVSLCGGGPGLVPDILADVDADVDTGDGIDRAGITRPAVAVFIEDAVVGQEHLVVGADMLAVVDNGGGIVNILVGIDKADDQGDSRRGCHHLFQRPQVFRDKLRFEKQVFGRVAADGKLGEGENIHARRFSFLNYRDDLTLIAGKITDRSVNLSNTDAESAGIRPLSHCDSASNYIISRYFFSSYSVSWGRYLSPSFFFVGVKDLKTCSPAASCPSALPSVNWIASARLPGSMPILRSFLSSAFIS